MPVCDKTIKEQYYSALGGRGVLPWRKPTTASKLELPNCRINCSSLYGIMISVVCIEVFRQVSTREN